MDQNGLIESISSNAGGVDDATGRSAGSKLGRRAHMSRADLSLVGVDDKAG